VEGTTDNEKLILPKGVEVYEIEGPFFFGIANKFEETMKQIGDSPKIRIIRMRKVPFIDSTGLHNLENLIKLSSRDKIQLLLSGVNENVYDVLKKAGVVEKLGEENVCRNINIALQRAQKIVGS
jgi:SulP family sulfate permease